MSDQRHSHPGAAANISAAVAAIFFGASVVAVRIAVREVPPLTLAFLRFGQGALALGAGLALLRRNLFHVERRDIPYLALLGLVFYGVFPFTFNLGVRYIEASRAALLLATMPLFTVALARSLSRERLTTRQIVGVLISVLGVGVVMVNRGGGGALRGSLVGDLLLLTTALCGAIYNVLAKRMLGRYTGVTVTFYAMTFGTLFLLPALSLDQRVNLASLNTQTMVAVVFLGLVGGGLAFALWTSALRRLSPTEVAVYINLNPLAATLLAATLLHERLSWWFAVGFVAVAAGVTVVNAGSGVKRER